MNESVNIFENHNLKSICQIFNLEHVFLNETVNFYLIKLSKSIGKTLFDNIYLKQFLFSMKLLKLIKITYLSNISLISWQKLLNIMICQNLLKIIICNVPVKHLLKKSFILYQATKIYWKFYFVTYLSNFDIKNINFFQWSCQNLLKNIICNKSFKFICKKHLIFTKAVKIYWQS